MCVWVHVYVCVCVYVQACVYTCVFVRVCTHACLCMCVRMRVCVCTNVRTYVRMYPGNLKSDKYTIYILCSCFVSHLLCHAKLNSEFLAQML